MTLRRTTIDLEQSIEKLQEDIEEIEKTQEEFKDFLNDEYNSPEKVPNDIEQKWESYEDEKKTLTGMRHSLNLISGNVRGEEDESWGGKKFVIQELSGKQLAAVEDAVDTAAGKIKGASGEDLNSATNIDVVNHSIVEAPPEAPDNAGDYPAKILAFLFREINEFNTLGGADFQKTSIREVM